MSRALRAGAFLPLSGFALLAGIPPAQASLKICNQTSYVLYAAVGWKAGADNVTQGWTRVVPGDCTDAIQAPLSAPNYYLYARTSKAHSGPSRAWGGAVQFCSKDTNFTLHTPGAVDTCATDDAFLMGYAPLGTRGMPSWTTTLTEENTIASDAASRAAGLDRLLGDNGMKIVGTGAARAKARDAAVAGFRKRMKLAANAGMSDLFDALETEALKVAAPAGYSICNDTDGVIWGAIGLAAGKEAVSIGWWKVPPGGCAHAVTEPLKIDRVYLHVEGHNKPTLVSGPAKFCTTSITFQLNGTNDCKKRGLAEAGFAATNTKNMTGYSAHIGNDGLMPQAPSQHAR
jgi:uncharacterized membrane protein